MMEIIQQLIQYADSPETVWNKMPIPHREPGYDALAFDGTRGAVRVVLTSWRMVGEEEWAWDGAITDASRGIVAHLPREAAEGLGRRAIARAV